MNVGMRELTRDVVRAQLADALFDVFLAQGFEQTTVEEASRAVGISRATFFRYFPTKDDAIVAAMPLSNFGEQVRGLAPIDGETPWGLVRRAFQANVAVAERNPARLLGQVKMIGSVGSLRAALSQRRAAQEGDFVAALTERFGDSLTARVFATTSLAAFDLAWREWSERSDSSFSEIVDSVFDRLEA